MKIVKKILTVVFAVSFGLFCLLFPVEVRNGAGEGLNRCITVIIPSLYAMMTASTILLESGALSTVGRWVSPVTKVLFGLNGELAAVFFFSQKAFDFSCNCVTFFIYIGAFHNRKAFAFTLIGFT